MVTALGLLLGLAGCDGDLAGVLDGWLEDPGSHVGGAGAGGGSSTHAGGSGGSGGVAGSGGHDVVGSVDAGRTDAGGGASAGSGASAATANSDAGIAGGTGAVSPDAGGVDVGATVDAGRVDGGTLAEPVTLATGAFGALALEDGSLFLVDTAGAELVRVSTAGGALEPISAPLELLPHRLVADGGSLYAAVFSRPGRTELWRVPSSGGGFDAELGGQLLSLLPSVASMAVNASDVVSLEARPTPSSVNRQIARTDKAGADAALVARVDPVFSDAFALDDAAAFVVRGGDVQEIVRVGLATGNVSVIANTLAGESVRDLAVGNAALYFASSERVASVSTAGGEPLVLSAAPAYELRARSQHVYFFSSADVTCEAGSELYRVRLSDGLVQHLASEPRPGCISELSADDDGLYWLTADASELRAVYLP